MKLRSLITGQVLLREGDPPGPMYVITAGRLRVFRGDVSAGEARVDLALLSAGDVIGELGTILARPRSANVQALEPSKVLEILPDELPRLAQQHQSLLRVIVNALRDRAGVSVDELDKLSVRLGLLLPAVASDAVPQSSTAPSAPVPAHDPSVVFPKMVDCPVCGSQFAALTLRARKDLPAERESDFHNRYTTPHNPYDYELWVCPTDLYAALPADFTDLPEKHRRQVAATVEQLVAEWSDGQPDFLAQRSLRLRQRALELAFALYRMRELGPARLGAIAHRLAWVARERVEAEAERVWLARALDLYTRAFSETDLGDAKEELRLQYLCGELTLRLGDPTRAFSWLSDALRHPAIKEHATWQKLLREQVGVAREQMMAEGVVV